MTQLRGQGGAGAWTCHPLRPPLSRSPNFGTKDYKGNNRKKISCDPTVEN